MSTEIKELVKKILYGPLSPIASTAFALIASLEYRHYMSIPGDSEPPFR